MKPHWYRITVHECPICGDIKRYRERMYTPKPEDPMERFIWRQYYNYCQEN